MATINLRDFYPFYPHDCFVEVPDEIAVALEDAERLERNYIRRNFYNKAHYSLDAEDGIETAAVFHIIDPSEVVLLMERHCRLCRALNSLPEIQGRRIEAHYLLGKSIKEIAEAEEAGERAVRKSIACGLAAMKSFYNRFD
ncbi:MAG: sigma-70 family RNA polymerase sigma factor [Treponema sp.]|jgi:RNA polymerase sigma-70 factor (ECF subfamily)|nr:sigma-70 family RNA polymerase sigma factor [Treponema sp.]